jgi:glutamine synthetase
MLARSAQDKLVLVPSLSLSYEKSTVTSLSRLADSLESAVTELEKRVVDARMVGEVLQTSRYYHDQVLPAMAEVRSISDSAELLMGESYYPIPTYEQLLYSV